MQYQEVAGGICAPKGFAAAGVHCGIRANHAEKYDLALIKADVRCAAAGVYTTNKVCGAPIKVDRAHLKDGYAQAIIVNSGNANTCAANGVALAEECCELVGKELGIDPKLFETNDINIHVPEGAIPKDGPSAGITMVTSIVSSYTGRKVKERIAMTGETTLRGRVMPVGGVREKILAAKRAGITELILSEENRKDIAEIKPEYVEGLTFHYVKTNDEVLKLALV